LGQVPAGSDGDSHRGQRRLLLRAGVLNIGGAEQALESFDQVRAMAWRLLNPKT
jgi:hypothetical protein